jgi:endogenous inhibitor of DNA gyrase (YacG/DUF329 family)
MTSVRCSVCQKEFDPEASRAMPFCSERCRMIDLNRWLNEDIAIPYSEGVEGSSPRDPDGEPED